MSAAEKNDVKRGYRANWGHTSSFVQLFRIAIWSKLLPTTDRRGTGQQARQRQPCFLPCPLRVQWHLCELHILHTNYQEISRNCLPEWESPSVVSALLEPPSPPSPRSTPNPHSQAFGRQPCVKGAGGRAQAHGSAWRTQNPHVLVALRVAVQAGSLLSCLYVISSRSFFHTQKGTRTDQQR